MRPCPFCGCKNIATHKNYELDGIKFYYCGNEKCGAVVSFVGPIDEHITDIKWKARNSRRGNKD